LPEGFLDWHGDTLRAGTLAELMSMPGEPYANPQMAAVRFMEWRRGKEDCHADRVFNDTELQPTCYDPANVILR